MEILWQIFFPMCFAIQIRKSLEFGGILARERKKIQFVRKQFKISNLKNQKTKRFCDLEIFSQRNVFFPFFWWIKFYSKIIKFHWRIYLKNTTLSANLKSSLRIFPSISIYLKFVATFSLTQRKKNFLST